MFLVRLLNELLVHFEVVVHHFFGREMFLKVGTDTGTVNGVDLTHFLHRVIHGAEEEAGHTRFDNL